MIHVMRQPRDLRQAEKFLYGEEKSELLRSGAYIEDGKPLWCGQTCLAMLAGGDLRAAIEATGCAGGCGEDDIRRGMKALGLKENAHSKVELLLVQYAADASHWMLALGELVLDPDGPAKQMSEVAGSIVGRIGVDLALITQEG